MAFDADEPVVAFHDLPGEAQTEAGAASRRLGGEERIEDAWEHVRWNARARVDHRDLHAGARVRFDVLGPQLDGTPRCGRVQRVADQVQDRRLDLHRTHLDLRQLAGDGDVQI